MSSIKFNRGVIPLGLTRLFGIKGQFETEVDGIIQPTVSVANLVDSPYLQYGSMMGKSGSQAAVAGENGLIVASPGAQVALQIKRVMVRNTSAAPLDCVFTLVTAANIVTAGIAQFANFVDLSNAPAGEARSSFLSRGSHTAVVGSEVGRITVPADNLVQVEFPEPGVILYGNDEGGIPGLAVWCETVNTLLEAVTFYAREWPLPG